ncbi:MAG: NPCBM/NEW2 domain-containing protein [bacterium]
MAQQLSSVLARCSRVLASLMILSSICIPQSKESILPLSSLDLTKVRQGWGKAQANKSVTEKQLSIAGQNFAEGVGTHASSAIWIQLDGKTDLFIAKVGVDDGAKEKPGSVLFRILGDGKQLWASGTMKPGQPASDVRVKLGGIKTLILMAGDAGDGISFDHADWVDAKFTYHGKAPIITHPPLEPKVTLTRKSGPKPKINGAKIFGVRPSSPFLFTIASTGDRPMTFAVKGLPAGLRVDERSGQITGAIAQRGTYHVTFAAGNKLGKAERKFTIVCGDELALTPHMGWNSWYVWENHVTDKIMRDAADAMVNTGMINHGYQYINIDDCWSVKPVSKDSTLLGDQRDAQGKINANKRFPDMKALTDYIHSKGLKAGIYTSPGPTTCAGHISAYQHEEQDVQRYVEWGYDFLKYDWCSYGAIEKE